MANKQALSRERYIDAALELIQAEGDVSRLSLRKVAARLDSSAMAMYKHFPNKEALLEATLDAFIRRSDPLPDPQLDWEPWLREMSTRMYNTMSREVSWIPMLGKLKLGEGAMFVIGGFITKLVNSGFTLEQAKVIYVTVVQAVLGSVCMSTSAAALARANDPNPRTLLLGGHESPLDMSMPLMLEAFRRMAASNAGQAAAKVPAKAPAKAAAKAVTTASAPDKTMRTAKAGAKDKKR